MLGFKDTMINWINDTCKVEVACQAKTVFGCDIAFNFDCRSTVLKFNSQRFALARDFAVGDMITSTSDELTIPPTLHPPECARQKSVCRLQRNKQHHLLFRTA